MSNPMVVAWSVFDAPVIETICHDCTQWKHGFEAYQAASIPLVEPRSKSDCHYCYARHACDSLMTGEHRQEGRLISKPKLIEALRMVIKDLETQDDGN